MKNHGVYPWIFIVIFHIDLQVFYIFDILIYMLDTLKIKNVALISEATVRFDSKLNIISGETGAGKSVLLDSINLILGVRADKSLIKQGEDFLKVDATFIDINNGAKEYLKELDFECDDCLMISRKINLEGKNEIRLNGEIIPLNILKTLAGYLIATHSQNENLSLISSDSQLKLLDDFAGLNKELEENKVVFDELKKLNNEIESLNGDSYKRERELDLLNYQIDEIERASLKENEENELKLELITLKNFEKISDNLKDLKSIYNGSYNASGLSNELRSFENLLIKLESYNEKCTDLKNRLNSAVIEIEDVYDEVLNTFDLEDFSENRLEEIDNRLDVYKRMFSKYGNSLEKVNEFYFKAKERQEYLINFEANLEKLNKQKSLLLKKAFEISSKISLIRKEKAKELENLIVFEVRELSMPNAKLEFKFNENITFENFENAYNKTGFDKVELLFSANLGESVKPLNLVASGGEISRLMLAIKTVCSDLEHIQTLIFDEIDTGISGEAAFNTSKKLAKISRNKQVIVVSHLFQICAMADKNILVKKQEENLSTSTKIIELKESEELISELTRFLNAGNLTTASQEHAREVKALCDNFKLKL